MNNPVDKLQMFKDSHRCLIMGLVSLLSLVGVPFAMMATASRSGEPGIFWFCFFISLLSAGGFPFALITLVISVEVRAREREMWNAARPYRVAGAICAMIALIDSFVVIALVTFLFSTSSLFGN